MGMETATNMFGAIADAGCVALARVPAGKHDHIKRVLDNGAHGVVVPMVNTRAEAEEAVRPASTRRGATAASAAAFTHSTSTPTRRLTSPRSTTRSRSCSSASTSRPCANFDEIFSVPGIDAVFVGPNDLAASMRGPDGKPPAPDVFKETLADILAGCKRNKVAAGHPHVQRRGSEDAHRRRLAVHRRQQRNSLHDGRGQESSSRASASRKPGHGEADLKHISRISTDTQTHRRWSGLHADRRLFFFASWWLVRENTDYALPPRSPARSGLGFGSLALTDLLLAESPNPLAPKKPHFPGKAKHVVHLFMNGGPSPGRHVRPEAAARQVSTASRCRRPNLRTERKTGAAMRSPFKFREVRQVRDRGQRTLRARRPDTSTTCASSARCTPTCRTTNRR